jgi:ABC-type sugar transport system substrate-binding protein
MMKKILVMLFALILVLSLMAGCAAPAPAATADEPVAAPEVTTAPAEKPAEKIKIGISFDSLESQWLVKNHAVLVQEIEARGAEAVSVMAEGDANKQNQQIENLIAQGVSAIICFPKDSAAIVTSIKKCQEAGIPIIMDNRSVSGDVLPDVQIVANNEGMAEKVLTAFAEIARKEGKTYNAILLIGGLADENAVYRKSGHDKGIANNSDVLTVVTEVPTDWNLDTALKGLQNALMAHPEANLIITPSDYLFPPIRSALEQIGRWGKIGEDNHFPVVSFDGDEVGMQYLKDGYNWADAAQDATAEGKMCVDWAFRLINGETPPQNMIFDEGQIVTVANFEEVAPTVWSYDLLK